LKPTRYFCALLFATILPLHAQIQTGQPKSLARGSSPLFALNLAWNDSDGLDGTISRLNPITGVVFDTVIGAGGFQSRVVSIEFPGHGNFRGRVSRDGSVITGRLLFRESPSSRALVRRFKLYYYTPTSSSGLTMTTTLAVSGAGSFPVTPVTNAVVVVQPIIP